MLWKSTQSLLWQLRFYRIFISFYTAETLSTIVRWLSLPFQVQRHLDDEKWYPAFGGVLRVIASLEQAGTSFPYSRFSSACSPRNRSFFHARRWNRSHERRKKRSLSSDVQNRRGINGWTWRRCTASVQRWGEKAVLQLPSNFSVGLCFLMLPRSFV